MVGTGRTLLNLSFSTNLLSNTLFSTTSKYPFPKSSTTTLRIFQRFKPICSTATATSESDIISLDPIKHSILLERLRTRHLKDSAKTLTTRPPSNRSNGDKFKESSYQKRVFTNFRELGLEEEVMGAVDELGITVPTEIQGVGIPQVLQGKSLVLGSHTGSGKTLAYMLPLVQLLRRDESLYGMLMKPRRPRAIVLCPTRELSEQVFRVSKSVSHHARFRSTMVSGGGRLRPQEDSLNAPIDMIVGTPGRVLQHIEDGNIVYGDIKYVVLDEADTMFDRGFGPDIRKFLAPLKNRALKSPDQGFQTILVTATMSKAVQALVDEEFEGIVHVRTSSLHKKIANARHDFIELKGDENKLEALIQVLEPSLSKGNRVMVFCNTLNSSRAVDHFLGENQIPTVNYHGEVPAEERVENLKKFKSETGGRPTLVCTDLAARGLDLDVDHVIMFDFPSNSIDYLHRTGRTARMGAKGKVTSLVAKKNSHLAKRIEEAINKNESLESLTVDDIKKSPARPRFAVNGKSSMARTTNRKTNTGATKPTRASRGTVPTSRGKVEPTRTKRAPVKAYKAPMSSSAGAPKRSFSDGRKSPGSSSASAPKRSYSDGNKSGENKKSRNTKPSSSSGPKLNVVGFRGRSSSFTGRRETSRAN
ncbi:DEAD-box ATP-dependent RNA helicase 39 [Ranunculus cassubicifolius]